MQRTSGSLVLHTAGATVDDFAMPVWQVFLNALIDYWDSGGRANLTIFDSGLRTMVTSRVSPFAVVWSVTDDFDAVADKLRGKGVTFEEYPEMGMEIRDGVHLGGGFKAVWFRDPDGNILHFNNM